MLHAVKPIAASRKRRRCDSSNTCSSSTAIRTVVACITTTVAPQSTTTHQSTTCVLILPLLLLLLQTSATPAILEHQPSSITANSPNSAHRNEFIAPPCPPFHEATRRARVQHSCTLTDFARCIEDTPHHLNSSSKTSSELCRGESDFACGVRVRRPPRREKSDDDEAWREDFNPTEALQMLAMLLPSEMRPARHSQLRYMLSCNSRGQEHIEMTHPLCSQGETAATLADAIFRWASHQSSHGDYHSDDKADATLAFAGDSMSFHTYLACIVSILQHVPHALLDVTTQTTRRLKKKRRKNARPLLPSVGVVVSLPYIPQKGVAPTMRKLRVQYISTARREEVNGIFVEKAKGSSCQDSSSSVRDVLGKSECKRAADELDTAVESNPDESVEFRDLSGRPRRYASELEKSPRGCFIATSPEDPLNRSPLAARGVVYYNYLGVSPGEEIPCGEGGRNCICTIRNVTQVEVSFPVLCRQALTAARFPTFPFLLADQVYVPRNE